MSRVRRVSVTFWAGEAPKVESLGTTHWLSFKVGRGLPDLTMMFDTAQEARDLAVAALELADLLPESVADYSDEEFLPGSLDEIEDI